MNSQLNSSKFQVFTGHMGFNELNDDFPQPTWPYFSFINRACRHNVDKLYVSCTDQRRGQQSFMGNWPFDLICNKLQQPNLSSISDVMTL